MNSAGANRTAELSRRRGFLSALRLIRAASPVAIDSYGGDEQEKEPRSANTTVSTPCALTNTPNDLQIRPGKGSRGLRDRFLILAKPNLLVGLFTQPNNVPYGLKDTTDKNHDGKDSSNYQVRAMGVEALRKIWEGIELP